MKNKCLSKRIISLVVIASVLSPNTVYAQDIIKKDQTVYINLNKTGKSKEEIVSSWINSNNKICNLEDESSLTDITNVKGDEVPVTEGNKIIWNSDNNNIFYQGKTNKNLPIDVKISYYLDGNLIKPEDLAGKSGKVKIKIDLKNLDEHTAKINGKDRKVYTPFTVLSVLNLPIDKFANVKLSDGDMVCDGNNQVVTLIGFPGLSESLKLDEYKNAADIDIPESFEINADVTNFEMGPIMITATPEFLTSDKVNKMENEISYSKNNNKIQEKLDKFNEKSYLKPLVQNSEFVEGERKLIDDSFTILGLDMSLLNFSSKYLTKSNINMFKKIKSDADIDINEQKIKPLFNLMAYKNKIKNLFDKILGVKKVTEETISPAVQEYIKKEKDILAPKLKSQITNADTTLDGLKKAKGAINKYGVVPKEAQAEINKVIDAALEQEKLNLKNTASKSELTENDKSQLLYVINTALDTEMSALSKSINSGTINSENMIKIKTIINNVLDTKKSEYVNAVNNNMITEKNSQEIKSIIEKIPDINLPKQKKIILENALDAGAYKNNAELKKNIVFIISSAIDTNKKELDETLSSGNIPKPLAETINSMVTSALLYEKQNLDNAIQSEKIDSNTNKKINDIIDSAVDTKKNMLKYDIKNNKLSDDDKKTLNNIISAVIDVYAQKLKDADNIVKIMNSNSMLNKSQLQMIMPIILENNKTVINNVNKSNLDDDSKKQINAAFGFVDGLMSNSKILDVIVNLESIKLDADDILKNNNMDNIMESFDYLDNISGNFIILKNDMKKASPILDSMQNEIDSKNLEPKFDELPSMMSTLKNTKEDLENNKNVLGLMKKALAQDNIDEANELLNSLEGFTDKYDEAKDVKDVLVKLADNYKSFTGIGKNMEGSVKFIMKTDEIKESAVENKDKIVVEEKNGFFEWLKKIFHIK